MVTHINEQHSKRIDEYTPKVWQYDELNEKFQKVNKDNETLINSNTSLNELVTQLRKDNNNFNSKFELLKTENANLKEDQIYLTNAKNVLEEKVQTQQTQINKLENELRETRQIHQNYIDKLTDKHLTLDITYKDKVKEELTEMKVHHKKDIFEIKRKYDELLQQKKIS